MTEETASDTQSEQEEVEVVNKKKKSHKHDDDDDDDDSAKGEKHHGSRKSDKGSHKSDKDRSDSASDEDHHKKGKHKEHGHKSEKGEKHKDHSSSSSSHKSEKGEKHKDHSSSSSSHKSDKFQSNNNSKKDKDHGGSDEDHHKKGKHKEIQKPDKGKDDKKGKSEESEEEEGEEKNKFNPITLRKNPFPISDRASMKRKKKSLTASHFEKIKANENDLDSIRSLGSCYVFNSEVWKTMYDEANKKANEKYPNKGEDESSVSQLSLLDRYRLIIQEGTWDACVDGYYYLDDFKKVNIPTKEMKKKLSEVQVFSKDHEFEKVKGKFDTQAFVINGDLLDVALWAQDNRHLKPVVLNIADKDIPGGWHRLGKPGLEEDIFRRTNMYQYLEECKESLKLYPIAQGGAILTPDVTVLRHPVEKGYKFREEPGTLCFLSTFPPLDSPTTAKLDKDGKITDKQEFEPGMTKQWQFRIKNLLGAALASGYETIVLTAFGCGRARNPPEVVAEQFQQVILENFLDRRSKKGPFHSIIFAILDDGYATGRKHNPNGNFAPFRDLWNQTKPETVIKCSLS